MSLTGALSTALSGLQTSSLAVQVASNNIANAQTAGYTKKGLSLSQQTTGTGFSGVSVSSYTRVSDDVLAATLNNATSNASYLNTQSSYLSQVQSILDSSSSTPALASAVSNFQSAWTQFSASSSDVTQQKSVIAAGQQLASAIQSISSQVSSLQTQVQNDLSTTVTSLNTDLAKVQTLNTQIATAIANGQATGDLQDQRDQAINAVAGITNVQVMQRSNGGVALYTPGGTLLIDGQAQTFAVSGNSVVNGVGADVSNVLTGGKLQAQTEFLSSSSSSGNGSNVIGKLTSQLQNFANQFVNTATGGFANTYNSATTASGELASGFFTATLDSNGLPDLGTFAVNSALTSGTSNLKQAAASSVANTFAATNLAINNTTGTTGNTFSATGLSVTNQTYAGMATAILSSFQQAANAVKTTSSAATAQQSYYQSALSSETGVNTDTELVNMTNWQNAYAASAHIISTIQSMMRTLENIVG